MDYKTLDTGTLKCNENQSHQYVLSYKASQVRIDVDDGKHVITSKGPGTLCQELRKIGLKPPQVLDDCCKQGLDALWAITEYSTKPMSDFTDTFIKKTIKEHVSDHLVEAVSALFLAMKKECV